MKKNILKLALHNTFLVFGIFLSACSKDDLPDFNKLENMRVLAFQVNTPEVNPGVTVTVTPIISDINATTLNYTVQTCLDPGVSVGAEPTCELNPTKQVIANQVALTIPGAAESWTGAADAFSVTVPVSNIIFANKSAQEKYNGVSFLVEYILTNNLGTTLRTIKRIIVSDPSKINKNTNPTITQVYADGAVMNALTFDTKINVTTDLAETSAESYTVQNIDGSTSDFAEKLSVTWFITDGKTKYFRSENTSSNEYSTPSQAPAGRSAYLIAVARDDRGGLSFVKKKF